MPATIRRIDGEAYSSIFFQNANNSVRVTDDFMKAVVEDKDWATRHITNGAVAMNTYRARDLMSKIAEAAWQCGDPGMQFDTTINKWHTSKNTAPHQRFQPVQRVHVPGRFGLQPVVAEPDEVSHPRRQVRR